MLRRKRKRLKKFNFHPITTFILMTLVVMILSSIFSALQLQVSYSKVNSNTYELEKVIVAAEGLFNFEGFKFIISNAAKNFISFTPLSTLLMGLIGLSVAHASGLIDAFIKRKTLWLNNKTITFILIFIATLSSIINDVGYVILIPLSALVFLANGRNPLLGITASFCGVAFGYGATLFAGSTEINLVPITTDAARLIDNGFHVSMLSNLIGIIISSIVVSIVGTFIVENILLKKIGKYKLSEEEISSETREIKLESVAVEEQKRIEIEVKEKRGLKNAFIALIVVILLFIYMIIPNLPGSGLLLDMEETAYINQLFGVNSYFQDGFTYLVSILFLATGIGYAVGAKTIKNDKELIEKASLYLKDVGYLVALIFFAAQFIAVFKKTNLGTIVVAAISNLIKGISFTGLPLIIVVLLLIAFCGLFITTQSAKWSILSPVVVPLIMQANISPQFTQFIFRAGDSMAKGVTPLLAYFVIYLGYLNIYNNEKEPITIKKALSFVSPYCLIISITWILIVALIYIVGLPIGPGVYPSL